jgi:hypothetical protein
VFNEHYQRKQRNAFDGSSIDGFNYLKLNLEEVFDELRATAALETRLDGRCESPLA